MVSKIYSAAELYEKAFSYRDIPDEVNFLLKIYKQLRKKQPASAIEIACGPAAHAIEMNRYISNVHALDNSQEMLTLASTRAKASNLSLHTHLADMRLFKLKQPIDLVFCMLDSLSHIHTKSDMIQHLKTIEHITSTDGIYIIELAKTDPSPKNWCITDNEGILHIQWGNQNDCFNPKNKLIKANIKMELKIGNRKKILQDILTFREWTLEDIQSCLTKIPKWTCQNIYSDSKNTNHLQKEANRIFPEHLILVLEKHKQT